MLRNFIPVIMMYLCWREGGVERERERAWLAVQLMWIHITFREAGCLFFFLLASCVLCCYSVNQPSTTHCPDWLTGVVVVLISYQLGRESHRNCPLSVHDNVTQSLHNWLVGVVWFTLGHTIKIHTHTHDPHDDHGQLKHACTHWSTESHVGSLRATLSVVD